MCSSDLDAPGDITVRQLVSFGRTPHITFLGEGEKEDEEKIAWAMEVTGISEYSEREISRLSGGQKQRAWIAMALAQDTKILFLDEPTTYLDVRYQVEILELIKSLNENFGLTIIMVRFKFQIRGEASSGRSTIAERSEERRVGKECRSRWSPYH